MIATVPSRHRWQMARASASEASAGVGLAGSRRIRVTMVATCALSARPLPVTAALTSLGVCSATGTPARAAASTATPAACAVPMTVRTLCWLKTRSTATTSGRSCSIQPSTASQTPSSRAARSAPGGVRTTSTATSSGGRPPLPSTAARPHRVSPGSTPSTRTPAPSQTRRGRGPRHTREGRHPLRVSPLGAPGDRWSADGLHDLVADVEVRVDVLHVVAVLEGVDQAEDLARALLVERYRDAGHEAHVGGVVVDAGVLQGLADRDDVARLADHLEAVPEVTDLLGPGLENGEQEVVLGQRPPGDDDHALAGEEVGHAVRVGKGAAVAGQRGADLRRRPVAVVGEALDQHRDAVRAVALVHDRLILGAAGLGTGAALDGAVDVVVGHRTLLRLLDGVVERRVASRVAAAGARRDLDVLDELGEHLAALGVDDRLLVLRRGPFGVAGHRVAFLLAHVAPVRSTAPGRRRAGARGCPR